MEDMCGADNLEQCILTDVYGKVTTYTYNDYDELLSQTYSDDTADITMGYDKLGRITTVTDAAGTTTAETCSF
ncbi:MAG: RHS repeat protein [Kiritimatiellae bacterium]|nr:RHS repeat protein [Kiritimatiellia bacterium]